MLNYTISLAVGPTVFRSQSVGKALDDEMFNNKTAFAFEELPVA